MGWLGESGKCWARKNRNQKFEIGKMKSGQHDVSCPYSSKHGVILEGKRGAETREKSTAPFGKLRAGRNGCATKAKIERGESPQTGAKPGATWPFCRVA